MPIAVKPICGRIYPSNRSNGQAIIGGIRSVNENKIVSEDKLPPIGEKC